MCLNVSYVEIYLSCQYLNGFEDGHITMDESNSQLSLGRGQNSWAKSKKFGITSMFGQDAKNKVCLKLSKEEDAR